MNTAAAATRWTEAERAAEDALWDIDTLNAAAAAVTAEQEARSAALIAKSKDSSLELFNRARAAEAAALAAGRPTVVVQRTGSDRRVTSTVVSEAAAPAPATDAQIGFLVKLLAGRAVSPEQAQDAADAAYAGKWALSAALDVLSALPWKPRPAAPQAPSGPVLDVPDGRYAVATEAGHLAFYKVTNWTSRDRQRSATFVDVMASDTEHRVRGAAAQAVLRKIADDPKAAMLRYGTEIGVCGKCGRTLTDESSREAGIGPVCAKGLGW